LVFAPTSTWPQDQAVLVGRCGQQVYLIAAGIEGSAHGLAVNRDRHQRRLVGVPACTGGTVGMLGGSCGGLLDQPGPDRGVHRGWVGSGEHPPQGGLRWRPRGPSVEPGHQLGGHIGNPASDRGERAHSGQHRRRTQRQDYRDRVIPALL
jgi:hypothetical protein